jgi:NhaP-type Na+/H+ or K+/H+ antiporter
LLVVCYAVVVLSMLVQALTMPMVIRWLYSRGPETRDSAVAAVTKPVEPA